MQFLVGVSTERHADMQLFFRRSELAFNYVGIIVRMFGEGELGFICPYNLDLAEAVKSPLLLVPHERLRRQSGTRSTR